MMRQDQATSARHDEQRTQEARERPDGGHDEEQPIPYKARMEAVGPEHEMEPGGRGKDRADQGEPLPTPLAEQSPGADKDDGKYDAPEEPGVPHAGLGRRSAAKPE